MERREFIKKTAIAAAAVAIAPNALGASSEGFSMKPQAAVGSDFSIRKNEVSGHVRTVEAVPSSLVCSKLITIEIDTTTDRIISCKFKGGCPGNAKGICSLIRDMQVKEVVARLKDIDCAGRGTSCPDQLSKVLRSI